MSDDVKSRLESALDAFLERVEKKRAVFEPYPPATVTTTTVSLEPGEFANAKEQEDLSSVEQTQGGPPPPPTPICYDFSDLSLWTFSTNNAGWFWATYDRGPRASTDPDNYYSHFRHYCNRLLIVDYNIDTATVDNVHMYYEGVGSSDHNNLVDWNTDTEVTAWLVPTPSALDELLNTARTAVGSDFNPPTAGKLRVIIYLELHRDFMEATSAAVRAGNPRRVDFDNNNTSSIPCVLKVCYQILL